MNEEFNPQSVSEYPGDVERIVAISGPNQDGRPKAHVLITWLEQFSDGTSNEVQSLTMDKPIINIFKHAGYVNVYLDFGSSRDMDLRVLWDMLSEFTAPGNSVSYLPEELEEGYYETPDGKKMCYFPFLDLFLSPIGEEEVYGIRAYNPVFFTLAPSSPTSAEACVLQLTFDEETFAVINDINQVDREGLQSEIMEEMDAVQKGYTPVN